MAKQFRTLVEFKTIPDLELLKSVGVEILNQSQFYPLVTVSATKEQIDKLTEAPNVKTVSLSPEIKIDDPINYGAGFNNYY